ncbi:type 1 periplasmic-binding domain-containing protein [Amycolatopsis eburnea]|uniref:BMP family ABC transporter substrate-binding protein n=1 Tax=Amycolatopsis eburnea TaxID=2267691 RepID=A0A3R9DV68_9PSEU|nr:hypothetical protein [Amycolatopsis eburnea]RSD11750.1 hypothetical protein EIY87_33850 [Amycolatopsis eburnea]
MRTRIAGTLAVLAVLAGGCGAADDWSAPHPAPSAVGVLAPGFVTTPPTPEATITPSPGSWDGVRPSPGYRVVLLTAGDDQPTRTLAAAVTEWARQEGVSLKTVTAADSGRFTDSIGEAVKLAPDLIVTAGKDLVDALALVTANHLDRQFLVLGAELAEPTANVTAANWPGASFRGEGLGTSTGDDPASFTPARADAAVRAGVVSVLSGLTGIVIRLG